VVAGLAVVAGPTAELVVELTPDADDRGVQLLVDAVVLERALLDVGDPAARSRPQAVRARTAAISRALSEAIMSVAVAARSPRRARCG
jgi:hypothetical protein